MTAEATQAGQEAPAATTVLHTTLEVGRQNFGQLLQDCRLRRELTIAQAASQARINQDTLARLESGDLGAVRLRPYYAKSAIEALCLVYDANPEPILDAYELQAGEYLRAKGGDRKDASPIPEDDDTLNSAAQHQIAQLLIAVVLVAVAVLVVASWLYKGYQARHQAPTEKFDLPALLPLEPPPMETLDIP